MRLFELDQPDPLVTKLIAVADQLHSDLDNKEMQADMSVDDLLSYFQKYDIVLDKMDLYNMIKKPPLNQMISNIQGDEVIFKGSEDEELPDDQKKDTVAAMAKHAMK